MGGGFVLSYRMSDGGSRLCVCGWGVWSWVVVEGKFFYLDDCWEMWFVYLVDGLVIDYEK